jgi:hypothetical protein
MPWEMNLMLNQKLRRRTSKLGDYAGAVVELVEEINSLAKRTPKTLEALVVEEVRYMFSKTGQPLEEGS